MKKINKISILLFIFLLPTTFNLYGQAGVNWNIQQISQAERSWYGVTYGNGLFVAVAYSGTGNRVMTSPDGITWTARTSTADNNWFSVTYGNGLFVAVATSGAGNRVMTSADGITWTARTSAADNSWYNVTYGNGLFVAVAVTGTGNRVMTSPDGITWTARTSAADNEWTSVTYGNGLFVAVATSGTGNRVMTSADGITWTARTSAADNLWFGVTYGNGLFVAVATSGSGNQVMTSGTIGVLPLQWGDIKAQKQGNKALLTWTTYQEQNTANFEVQHSANSQQWTAVGSLPAAGNSDTVRNYRFVHEGPFKNSIQHHYRILQRDLDGKFSYSKIVSITFNESGSDVRIYPNPVRDIITIFLAESQQVHLLNMGGATVWKGRLAAGRNQLSVAHFPKGVYMLQTNTGPQRIIID